MRCTCTPFATCAACLSWRSPLLNERPLRRPRQQQGPLVLNRTKVARALKAFRRREGLTMRQAAARLALSYGTVQSLEHGMVFRPSARTLEIVHTHLGIPKKHLLTRR